MALGKLGEMIDLGELLRRIVKYLVEGIMVAIAAYAIPKKSLNELLIEHGHAYVYDGGKKKLFKG